METELWPVFKARLMHEAALDSAPRTEAEPRALAVKAEGERANVGAESQGRAVSTEVPGPLGRGQGRGRDTSPWSVHSHLTELFLGPFSVLPPGP